MKRITTLFIVLLVFTSSCKQKVNYSEDIQGKWLCQEIKQPEGNPLIIATNDVFTAQFNSDASVLVSKGYTLPNYDHTWCEKQSFAYTIDGNKLLVKGKNVLGEEIELSLSIERLTSIALTCKENYYKVQGEEKENGRTFYFSKIYKNYEKEIIGSWDVRKVAKLDPDTFVFAKYVFADANKLNIYNLEGDKCHDAQYFLNGELLSINYPTNFGNDYRCWLIQEHSENRIVIKNWQVGSGNPNILQGTTYELIKNPQIIFRERPTN